MKKVWKARNKFYPDFYAESFSSATSLIIGKHTWQVYNDSWECPSVAEVTLTLTPCSDDEFSCDNGICIPMNKRCNGKLECKDGSDEDNCDLVVFNNGYNKYLVPMDSNSKFTVSVYLYILEISYINEIDGYFTTLLDVGRKWYDHNIRFRNLQKKGRNRISTLDKSLLWYPYIVFSNVETITDLKKTDYPDEWIVIPNDDYFHTRADQVLVK